MHAWHETQTGRYKRILRQGLEPGGLQTSPFWMSGYSLAFLQYFLHSFTSNPHFSMLELEAHQ